jgi:hypothetical protein
MPFGVARCLGGACMPDANGCDTVCGNKLDPKADQTKFISQCVPGANGFNWLVTGCLAPATCAPKAGSSCLIAGNNAACSTVCTPGAVRCSPDSTGTQICDPTGNWGAITACDVGSSQTCFVPNGATNAVCGDRLCAAGAQGTCVLDGGVTKFQPCGANGKLGTAAPCAQGVCVVDPSVTGPQLAPQPGMCQVECLSGDTRCIGGTAVNTCDSNGTWSTSSTSCALDGGVGVQCFNSTSAAGRPLAVCGVCQPGTHRCVNTAGTPDAGAFSLPDIETCGSNAQWGGTTPCTVGQCVAVSPTDAACLMECVPNVTLKCVGVASSIPGTPYSGTNQQELCDARGFFGANTFCAAGTACRTDSAGNSYGCVTCVSGKNEAGLTDTRCANAAGTAAGTDAVQTCVSGAWSTLTQCTSVGLVCQMAMGTTPASPSCHACRFAPAGPPNGPDQCSESNLAPLDCVSLGEGAPIACGGTPDCCTNDCFVDPSQAPSPASCSLP